MARKAQSKPTARILGSIGRSPVEQALANLENASRVLAMLSGDCSGMCPHPSIVVAAEIANARRHLALVE